jgi:nitrogen-specific signal transduction histidine kinase
MTTQVALKAKEEQLERTVFWAELAASLSHEISNPLVTIQTFAQCRGASKISCCALKLPVCVEIS